MKIKIIVSAMGFFALASTSAYAGSNNSVTVNQDGSTHTATVDQAGTIADTVTIDQTLSGGKATVIEANSNNNKVKIERRGERDDHQASDYRRGLESHSDANRRSA
jgi:hypothetical protein